MTFRPPFSLVFEIEAERGAVLNRIDGASSENFLAKLERERERASN